MNPEQSGYGLKLIFFLTVKSCLTPLPASGAVTVAHTLSPVGGMGRSNGGQSLHGPPNCWPVPRLGVKIYMPGRGRLGFPVELEACIAVCWEGTPGFLPGLDIKIYLPSKPQPQRL